jgi:PPK2 family polyphosphate:nucleotide phosphotransferase
VSVIRQDIIDLCRVPPGKKLKLKDHTTGWAATDELKDAGKDVVKKRAEEIRAKSLEDLAAAQDMLYADNRYSLLVIFQAMDAAGKDGTIKHVMSGVNPQGCQVFSFKQPSAEEQDHNFLWRYMKSLPEYGRIGIFNRSYYEDVLVVKVHPELLKRQQIDLGKNHEKFWQGRYDDINAFERHLVRSRTIILKFFLNVSKKEQKKRFLERLSDPDKHWKFSATDVAERAHWGDYMDAYEDALAATSTKWAPWYVVPADDKWAMRTIVADIVTTTLRDLDLRYPPLDEAQESALEEARVKLANE